MAEKTLQKSESGALKFLRQYAIYFIMLGIFIVFAVFLRASGFLSAVNIMNIFRQTAMISIMAVGFTFL